MKNLLKFCAIALFAFTACKTENANKENNQDSTQEVVAYESFGETISQENAMNAKEMFTKYASLKQGDTINVKFATSIDEVCAKKGCWMKIPLNDDTKAMVRFKDYGFFMPLDAKDREVILEGKAFVQETTVEELQHYAEDAGKSKEEIAEITEPKIEYAFVANGVLMKK